MNFQLTLALKKHLETELAGLNLVHQSDDGRDQAGPPRVWIGDLPPKRRKDAAGREIPCVVIVPHAGHQEDGHGMETVALVCIVYNPEDGDGEGGENDMSILISGIFKALMPALESKGRPLANRFVLEPDNRGRILPWEKSGQQPRPFLQAAITSQWRYKGWE